MSTVEAEFLDPDGPRVAPLDALWAGPATGDHDRETAERAAGALDAPLGFPPIARAVTPDDYVAIALGESTPAAPAVVAGLLQKLADTGIDRSRMAVVAADPADAGPLRAALAAEVEVGVLIESHDPDDEDSLCFAGLTNHGRQLLLNRRLFDADVLLPVSAERPVTRSAGGPFDGVFPAFCDRETLDRVDRVRAIAASRRPGEAADARRSEADEAGWLFGAPLVVRVVPGPPGGSPSVIAGEPTAVADEAARLGQRLRRCEPASSPALVVARLAGGRRWSDVGAALEAIDGLVTPGAAVALWTELDEPIGRRLAQLGAAGEPGRVAADLLDESGSDAWAAWWIAQAIERGPVYLRSRLDDADVEDLGFTAVASEAELERLAAGRGSVVVVDDAAHVCVASEPTTTGEPA